MKLQTIAFNAVVAVAAAGMSYRDAAGVHGSTFIDTWLMCAAVVTGVLSASTAVAAIIGASSWLQSVKWRSEATSARFTGATFQPTAPAIAPPGSPPPPPAKDH